MRSESVKKQGRFVKIAFVFNGLGFDGLARANLRAETHFQTLDTSHSRRGYNSTFAIIVEARAEKRYLTINPLKRLNELKISRLF